MDVPQTSHVVLSGVGVVQLIYHARSCVPVEADRQNEDTRVAATSVDSGETKTLDP